jgi:hypothetical protein
MQYRPAIHPFYEDADDYSDRVYEAALRAFGRGPEELDKIDYVLGFQPYGSGQPFHVTGHKTVRPQLTKDYSGPIGSYRMSDWQPADTVADETGKERRPNTFRPGPSQSGMSALDEWGNQWSSTAPKWVKVDGQYVNVDRLLWGGYRSDARRQADQAREGDYRPGEVRHASGYSTMTQQAAPTTGPRGTAKGDASQVKPEKVERAPKPQQKTAKKKSGQTSQTVVNQFTHQPGDMIASYSPAMRGYY